MLSANRVMTEHVKQYTLAEVSNIVELLTKKYLTLLNQKDIAFLAVVIYQDSITDYEKDVITSIYERIGQTVH